MHAAGIGGRAAGAYHALSRPNILAQLLEKNRENRQAIGIGTPLGSPRGQVGEGEPRGQPLHVPAQRDRVGVQFRGRMRMLRSMHQLRLRGGGAVLGKGEAGELEFFQHLTAPTQDLALQQ